MSTGKVTSQPQKAAAIENINSFRVEMLFHQVSACVRHSSLWLCEESGWSSFLGAIFVAFINVAIIKMKLRRLLFCFAEFPPSAFCLILPLPRFTPRRPSTCIAPALQQSSPVHRSTERVGKNMLRLVDLQLTLWH